jgi:5'-nucleotidase
MRPRLLVTNDDGIHAPGLHALVEALAADFEVLVVAPERQQSAVGHSITLHKPLRLEPVRLPVPGVQAFQTNGTPADCVVLGTWATSGRPRLVVGGINSGANLAEEIFYSGTVSAAMEAAIQGLPAFAISLTSAQAPRFEVAARFARHLALALLELELPAGSFLNVNVPNLPADQLRPPLITRLGRRCYRNQLEKRTDPRGRPYYWFTGEPTELDSGPDTDIGAVASGHISITPVQLDATNYALKERLQERLADLAAAGWGGGSP